MRVMTAQCLFEKPNGFPKPIVLNGQGEGRDKELLPSGGNLGGESFCDLMDAFDDHYEHRLNQLEDEQQQVQS